MRRIAAFVTATSVGAWLGLLALDWGRGVFASLGGAESTFDALTVAALVLGLALLAWPGRATTHGQRRND